MKRHDLIGGLIWVLLGMGICVGSVQLKLGNFHRPGPGFMPFLSGGFLILFGLILAISAILIGKEKGEMKAKETWGNLNWKSLIFTLLALFSYAFLLEFLGFYSTAFIFLFFLFKLKEPKRWFMPLLIAGIAVAVSYIIFSTWLKCQFPTGILRF